MERQRRERIASNLATVQQRIATAALQAGRHPDSVRLIAVTKYVGIEEIAALYDCGCVDLGESRPQSLWEKTEQLRALRPKADLHEPRWHLIGHLQRNKVLRTLPLTHLIHSADSLRLVSEIESAAGRIGRTIDLLLEVNVSQDAAKHGFAPHELREVPNELRLAKNLRVRGFMAMSGLHSDEAQIRAEFARLRELRDHWQRSGYVDAAELSMGMSGDFELAIAEGATMVRIGSALFDGIDV